MQGCELSSKWKTQSLRSIMRYGMDPLQMGLARLPCQGNVLPPPFPLHTKCGDVWFLYFPGSGVLDS